MCMYFKLVTISLRCANKESSIRSTSITYDKLTAEPKARNQNTTVTDLLKHFVSVNGFRGGSHSHSCLFL